MMKPIMHHSFLVLAESVGWSTPTIIPLNIRIITIIAGITIKIPLYYNVDKKIRRVQTRQQL